MPAVHSPEHLLCGQQLLMSTSELLWYLVCQTVVCQGIGWLGQLAYLSWTWKTSATLQKKKEIHFDTIPFQCVIHVVITYACGHTYKVQ